MPQSIRFFAHNRWIRSTTVVAATNEATDHEADLTKTPALAETWRSTNLSEPQISANFTSAFKVGAVCLVRCNLTSRGLYRVRAGSTPKSSNLYDSGWIGRARYYSDSEIANAKTSEFFSSGFPVSGVQKRIQPQIIVAPFPSEVSAQYITIDFDDPTNPDGFIEIGYVYAGKTLEPDRDLMYGWKMQRDDFVREGRAASGQYWPSSVYNRTLVTLTMAPQRESDITAYWMLMEALVGINNEFIVSLINRSDSLTYTTTIYCKWEVIPGNTNIAINTWNLSTMAISEIVD